MESSFLLAKGLLLLLPKGLGAGGVGVGLGVGAGHSAQPLHFFWEHLPKRILPLLL
jgi:hypothetical protein